MRRSPSSQARRHAVRFVPRFEELEERTLLSTLFTPPINTSPGLGPHALATADFNHDGIPDLAVGLQGSTGGVSLLLGDGHGGFTPAPGSPLLPGVPVNAVVAGDFNGDGAPDLAVASSAPNQITCFLNDGHGKLVQAPGSPFNPGPNKDPVALAVGNFIKGDNIPDLAVSFTGNNRVGLLVGAGDGSFTESSSEPLSGAPGALAVGDFNGDGMLDIVVTEPAANKVATLVSLNPGILSLSGEATGFHGPDAIVTGAFDGDNKLDYAVANLTTNNVTVVLGQGGTPLVFPAGSGPSGLTVHDFNDDGHLDLAVADSNGGVTLLNGQGNGTFTVAAGSPFTSGPNSLAVTTADFNGDGAADLAVVNGSTQQVSVLLNEGATTTTLNQSLVVVGLNQSVTFTATVAAVFPSVGTPTGLVSFNIDGNVVTIPLNGSGQASFTTAMLTPGLHMVEASYSGDATFFASNSLGLQSTVLFQGDVTPLLRVGTSKVLPSGTGGVLREKIALVNVSGHALFGPFRLVLDQLPRGVRLRRQRGVILGKTQVRPPVGDPYELVNLAMLAPGQRALLTVFFVNPRGKSIHFVPRIVSGTGAI
jgi:hypothetical protein